MGWLAVASYLPPGTRRSHYPGMGLLLQGQRPDAAAELVVRRDSDGSSSVSAAAAETWQPFELTTGQRRDSTSRKDRLS